MNLYFKSNIRKGETYTMKKLSWPFIAIVILCILGLYNFIVSSNIINILIPVILVAGVVLLFKFPPNSWLKKGNRSSASYNDQARYKEAVKRQKQVFKAKAKQASQTSKSFPFKVIDGGKDDNDTPRYH